MWIVHVARILDSNINWHIWRLSYSLPEQGSDDFLSCFVSIGVIEKEVRDAEFGVLTETMEDQRTNVRQGAKKTKLHKM